MTNPDNEILLASEYDEDVLNVVSFSLAKCAEVLRETARDVLKLEPHIDSDSLEELSLVASEFDKDAELGKYSESIDNLLKILGQSSDRDSFINDIEEKDLESLMLDKMWNENQIREYTDKLNEIENIPENFDHMSKEQIIVLINKLHHRIMTLEDKLELINSVIDKKTESSINDAAHLANALDNSGDAGYEKLASVLDEILLTIGAPKGENYNFKAAEEAELDKLRAKYRADSSKFYGVGKERTGKIADESNKVIEQKVKKYKPNEHALSTRYCPDHNGQSVIRIADQTWQCPLDKKIYNYESGFKLEDGSQIPAQSVSQQNQNMADNVEQHLNFNTRSDVLNG